jgi:hypothetical protein
MVTSLFVLAMRLRTRALPTPRKAKPKSVAKETPPLKEGRRSADKRIHRAASKSDAARALSPVVPLREDRGPGLCRALDLKKWSGRARLSAPHRGIRGFLGLGSAQAALLRHQCSEHLAVRHAPDGTMPKPPASAVYGRAQREPLPLRPKEYPREGDYLPVDKEPQTWQYPSTVEIEG